MELQRRGPTTRLTDAERTERIRHEIAISPFTGEGHRKFWARLRVAGVGTSKTRVLRLMREAGLLAPQRQAVPVVDQTHTGRIVTDRPNQMWGIDATATVPLDDGQVTVFAAVDHCTAECVGLHAVKGATRFEALDPVRQGVKEYFTGFLADAAAGLQLRHDHGSQFMSDDFQNEIRFLGIGSSPAFVREPEGNGCIERFFKTLKEQLLWVRHFRSILGVDLRKRAHRQFGGCTLRHVRLETELKQLSGLGDSRCGAVVNPGAGLARPGGATAVAATRRGATGLVACSRGGILHVRTLRP